MKPDPNRSIAERIADTALMEKALQEAAREALRRHKQAGNPIAAWRDGRVVLIAPEDIRIDEEPALRKGIFACSMIGMIASVASEHSSPIATSGLYCSMIRLAACVAGNGLQAESSY